MVETAQPVLTAPSVLEDGPLAGGEVRCENCGASGQNTLKTWCRHCGYYAVVGRCVELDQEWEAASQPSPETEAETAEERPSLALALRAIPRWVWPLSAVVLGVLAMTVAGRVVTPPESELRIRWAYLQLGLGGVAFLLAQGWASVKAGAVDPQFGPWDGVLRPFAVWGPVTVDMSRALRPLMTSVGGATAMAAILLLGGFPYEHLFDGEITKKPPSQNLVQAITAQAQNVETSGEEDLGQSIEDFAGAQEGLVEDPAAGEEEIERPEAQDCLIIGYLPSSSPEIGFTALLMAAPVGDSQQLQFVGAVREGISPAARADLLQKLPQLTRNSPFVPCKMSEAVWLQPSLTCRVRFADWTESNFLKDAAFDVLLQKVESP